MKTFISTLFLVFTVVMTPAFAADSSQNAELHAQARRSFMRGDFAQAESAYLRMLAIAPSDLNALSGIGTVHLHANRIEAAKRDFERALAVHPDDVYCLSSLGYTHFRLNQFTVARALLDRAVQLDPDGIQTLHYLGAVCLKLGDTAAANRIYERLKKIDPALREPSEKSPKVPNDADVPVTTTEA